MTQGGMAETSPRVLCGQRFVRLQETTLIGPEVVALIGLHGPLFEIDLDSIESVQHGLHRRRSGGSGSIGLPKIQVVPQELNVALHAVAHNLVRGQVLRIQFGSILEHGQKHRFGVQGVRLHFIHGEHTQHVFEVVAAIQAFAQARNRVILQFFDVHLLALLHTSEFLGHAPYRGRDGGRGQFGDAAFVQRQGRIVFQAIVVQQCRNQVFFVGDAVGAHFGRELQLNGIERQTNHVVRLRHLPVLAQFTGRGFLNETQGAQRVEVTSTLAKRTKVGAIFFKLGEGFEGGGMGHVPLYRISICAERGGAKTTMARGS